VAERHTGRPWRRTLRLGALTGCGALLAVGCASMPDSGEVHQVDASRRVADSDAPQVRVFGVPPQKGEQPSEIVRGFLEATTSDEADFRTAREYLTAEASRNWQPFSQTTVLAEGPITRTERAGADQEQSSYAAVLSGTQLATVDRKHAYTPAAGTYQTTMHLSKVGGEWRIDGLPDGLVLGKSDFERIYRSVNKYYFAATGGGTAAAEDGTSVLVADPVYLRRRIDPVTEAVKALLEGPTTWLDPVVDSTFPSRTALVDDSLSLDDSNGLRVRLSDRAGSVAPEQCDRMAAQLLFTVQDQASAKLSRVELARKDGSELCVLTRAQADAYAPEGLRRHSEQQYFLDARHRLASLSGDEARQVPGPFGYGETPLRSAAVARTRPAAAGVSLDGRELYVARMESGAELGEPRLRSRSTREKDGLTAPSWDGIGDLWVADREAGHSRLLRLRDGTGTPEEVQVPGLGDGRIEALRVAADGVRIALLVQRDGRTSLELGRVERADADDRKRTLAVTGLRSVAPQLVDVVSASWAGGSRLVVVGRESGGVQQPQYVETDGSASNSPALPGISGVKGVAASEDESKPLVADSDEGIVRLPPDANWKMVTEEGSAPVYPG
jgi:two-component system sensor histidine kinase MtrB